MAASRIAAKVECNSSLLLLATSELLRGKASVWHALPKKADFVNVVLIFERKLQEVLLDDCLRQKSANQLAQCRNRLSTYQLSGNNLLVDTASLTVTTALFKAIPLLKIGEPAVAKRWKRALLVLWQLEPELGRLFLHQRAAN